MFCLLNSIFLLKTVNYYDLEVKYQSLLLFTNLTLKIWKMKKFKKYFYTWRPT